MAVLSLKYILRKRNKTASMDGMGHKPKAVIALGMFDGVHMGHKALLRQTIAQAKKHQARSYVFTFSNHPRSVFAQGAKLLMTAEERKASILAAGIDEVNMVEFTKETTVLSPHAYISQLESGLDVRAFVVGYDYTFGDKGMGTPDTLKQFGKEFGFSIIVIPPVLYNGEPVSSTRIRQLIENGEIESANEMLLSHYALTGNVVECRHIGASLGFPTANLLPPPAKVLPKAGVYAATVNYNNKQYPAVTNIGSNPTVNGTQTTIESHLLDFSENIYHENITVLFHSRLRGEKLFTSKEALASQIKEDSLKTRRYFGL